MLSLSRLSERILSGLWKTTLLSLMKAFYATIYSVVVSHAGVLGEIPMAWALVYHGILGVGNLVYGS